MGAVVPYLIYVVCMELCHVAGLLRFCRYRDEDQALLLGLQEQRAAFHYFPPCRVGRCYLCAESAFVHGELDTAWLKRHHTARVPQRPMYLLTQVRVSSHRFDFLP
jgi:hypothetical protein